MTMVNSEDINKTGCQNASGSLVPLHRYTYSNEMMRCLIHWSLHETNFSGLTVNVKCYYGSTNLISAPYYSIQGTVRFNENGTRIYANVRVSQYQRKGKIELYYA